VVLLPCGDAVRLQSNMTYVRCSSVASRGSPAAACVAEECFLQMVQLSNSSPASRGGAPPTRSRGRPWQQQQQQQDTPAQGSNNNSRTDHSSCSPTDLDRPSAMMR
jgi:hypothetical protein